MCNLKVSPIPIVPSNEILYEHGHSDETNRADDCKAGEDHGDNGQSENAAATLTAAAAAHVSLSLYSVVKLLFLDPIVLLPVSRFLDGQPAGLLDVAFGCNEFGCIRGTLDGRLGRAIMLVEKRD